MLDIKVDWTATEVRALMKKLEPARLHQALSVSVNTSARQVERKAETLVAKSLSIRVKRARQGIWIRPFSKPDTLSATVRGSASEIPLKAFNAKEVPGGVVATIWGAKRMHPGAFIHGGPQDGHNRELGMGGHVFVRTGKTWAGAKRGAIVKAKGAAIAEAMARGAVQSANEAYALERLTANVMRQLKRYAFKG